MLRPLRGPTPVIFQPKLDKRPRSPTVVRSPKLSLELHSPRARKLTHKSVVVEPDISKPSKVLYTVIRDLTDTGKIKTTPSFQQTKATDHLKLLIQKSSICSRFCDFSSPSIHVEEKQTKRETLSQILEVLLNTAFAKKLTGESLTALFSMIKVNLFRKLPSVRLKFANDIALDNEFTHIEFVYRILITIIESTTIRLTLLQPLVNDSIISNLFTNITSPDAREQRMACNCLCSITNKFFGARRIIQSKIHAFFHSILSNQALENSLSSFLFFYLEVMDTLKHHPNFHRMILPLMNSSRLGEFHETWYEIVKNFFLNDSHHVAAFLRYAMTHWPVQSVEKQSIILELIRQTFCDYARQIPKDVAASCVTRISDLFGDPTEDISHQSILMMCSEQMFLMLTRNGKSAAGRVYESAKRTAASHWIPATRNLAADLAQQMENRLPPENFVLQEREKREEIWQTIVNLAFM